MKYIFRVKLVFLICIIQYYKTCTEGPILNILLTLCLLHVGNFHAFLLSADFFFIINFFKKILSRITISVQTRPGKTLGMNSFFGSKSKLHCKGYQQTTLGSKELSISAVLARQ